MLENDKKRMIKELNDYQTNLDQAHARYFGLKKESEESPLSVLRNQIGTQKLELAEMESHVKNSDKARDEYRTRYENIKKDMVLLKKQIDQDKQSQLTKQAEELE